MRLFGRPTFWVRILRSFSLFSLPVDAVDKVQFGIYNDGQKFHGNVLAEPGCMRIIRARIGGM
jgi:hypothetical protein